MLKISLAGGLLLCWLMGQGCAPAYRPLALLAEAKPDDDFQQGERLYQKQQHNQAFNLYNSFIQHHPQDKRIPQAYIHLGKILIIQQRYAEAQHLLKQFLGQYPNSPKEAKVFIFYLEEMAS